jgi:hypothetical protein
MQVYCLRRVQGFFARLTASNVNEGLKNMQIIITFQRLFTKTFPPPLGPRSRLQTQCVWRAADMLYAEQKDVTHLLLCLTQYFVTACAGACVCVCIS